MSDMRSKCPVRVAFCLDSFAIGGTELNAVRTAEAIDPNRIELSVFHLQTRGPLRSRYEQLGVPMTHVPIPNLYSLRTVSQGVRFARLLRQRGIEVVHSHDIYCNIFAVPWSRLLCNCATIASRRWGGLASRPQLAKVNRWCSLAADRILANSTGVARLLSDDEGMPVRKIVEIPNFLDDAAFSTTDEATRAAERRHWGLPEGAVAVGIVARLSPVKNHALLFQALAQLDDHFHLVVVGDGPLRSELEGLGQRLGIGDRIHFLGELVSTDNLHRHFDISVLCSVSEGFPNSLIEAMAAARPVVATPVGGVTDVVKDGVSGILVPVDNPAALANALGTLAQDASLRRRLGEAGRSIAMERYRRDIVIDQLSGLYETLANRPLTKETRRVNG